MEVRLPLTQYTEQLKMNLIVSIAIGFLAFVAFALVFALNEHKKGKRANGVGFGHGLTCQCHAYRMLQKQIKWR